MPSRSLGHRAPLLWLAIPWIAGLATGQVFDSGVPTWQLAGALALAVMAVATSRRAPRLWASALVSAMVLAGNADYALQRSWLPTWDALPPREARFQLRVDRVFARAEANRIAGLGTVVQADEHLRDLSGQRLYFSLQLPRGRAAPLRSATVSMVGVLVALPHHPPADTFDGYLAAAGVNFRLTRGRMQAEVAPPTRYYRFCARLRNRFREILGQGIADRQPALAGLLRAMMLGETHELSDEQQTLFMQSGTMHLFAISGLNISVIAVALESVFRLLRLPGLPRVVLVVSLLWLFVDITGGSASAVRAFIMTAFLYGARVLRRPGTPLAALVASAVAVLVVAPLQVFSASFVMSYAIVTALLLLGLPLAEAWHARWSPWRDLPQSSWGRRRLALAGGWRRFVLAVAIGVATTLVSLLTGVQFFQLLTPGALLSNLVLIPAATVATIGGFAAIVCGLPGFAAGAVLCNHAAAVTLLFIERFVQQSVHLPGAFIPARFAAPWIGLNALGLLLATLLAGYATHWRGPGRWWPPFVVVAITLLFGVRFG